MIILPSLRLIILLNLRIICLRRQEHIPKTQKMTKKWRSIKQAR